MQINLRRWALLPSAGLSLRCCVQGKGGKRRGAGLGRAGWGGMGLAGQALLLRGRLGASHLIGEKQGKSRFSVLATKLYGEGH